MPETIDRRARIAAIGKAFSVLELFGPESPDLRITDIASRADMSRSSAQRLVHTLLKCGWLHRDASGTLLSLSHRAVDPAFVYLSCNPIMDLVMPFVVELNARTALNCDLWLRDGLDLVTLARIPSPASSLALAPVGSRTSLTSSTRGRALLSCLSRQRLNEILPELALNPGDERERLLKDIASEHEAGYAIGDETGSGSGKVIAAAFLGADGEPLGVLSLSGVLDAAISHEAAGLLRQTANTINGLRISATPTVATFYPGSHVTWAVSQTEDDPLEIASVTKALHLLQFFHPGAPLLTLTELSKKTGFPIPTVQRIVDTFIDLGYLVRQDKNRAYHISIRSLDLLYRFQMSSNLVRSVWPRLIRFREECGLRCSFCILDGTEIVHLLHVQSRPHPDYRTAHPGRRFLAASSSGGRAMLSWLPDEEIRKILDDSMIDPFTAHTVTDRDAIFADIKCASARGVAFTDRQSVRDEVNVAAAVRGPDGRPIGAIVVSAPARTWTIDRLEKEVVPSLLSHSRSGDFS
ncbi:DNA-binding IclR family transcriptional regulator [Neorhizobium huautlense]|uniref:DNA-binding IclR family transcriptional regulator n=1 Tax=Neorhizobium huautlense TaxID=67774 RepID=A0ABT9PLH6_9HYPH|nr:IclR family transcriptional regulator [Neorhizobium huautlense]MDP9835319.1 DNA-binding IclR family transcriptional regulator [Neorhizobium huautlense]